MRPIIIDVEASGFGRGSYPIEIGVALQDGSSHCTLIKREAEWVHWDASAESLHGISQASLSQAGKSIVEVATLLNQWLEGQTVYSDAWGNDSSWIALLFDCAEMSQHFRLESLSGLLSESQQSVWHQTKDKVTAELGFCRHRASNDALILQQTYCQTMALATPVLSSVN